jgi:hypothetical protein
LPKKSNPRSFLISSNSNNCVNFDEPKYIKMKNLLLMIAVLAFALTGCKKSDAKLVANKWTGVSSLTQEFDAAGVLIDSQTESIVSSTLELKSDNTLISTENGTATNGKWTLVDKTLTLTTSFGFSIPYTIKELTSSKLVLFYSETTGGIRTEATVNFSR